ncbi:MAG: hypothetical protein LQ351_004151 [Letrouitia transgressa]|nr:MAG: hypothetical protein LQ351_004151 [Letrouitia transgressa]
MLFRRKSHQPNMEPLGMEKIRSDEKPLTEPDQVFKTQTSSTRRVQGNEVFNDALIKEPPKLFGSSSRILALAFFIGTLCSIMNGYEASLFNSLLQTPEFKDYFNIKNSGTWTGVVAAMYEIGSFTAFPFIGPALDTFGRRFGLLVGILILFIGTVVQGTTPETAKIGQYMGGRFLLGFGIAIAASAGPTYIVEISHPAYRGMITALYNTFCMIVVLVWFLPESPRWLYVHGQVDKAEEILINFHGNGDRNSVWVCMQLDDFNSCLKNDGADKRWWDYRALFRDRASVYRLACNCIVSVFGQWAGNAVISYFLSAVLDTAGITNPLSQTNINVGLNCVSFALAILGASFVDRIGRRPLLLYTNAGCCLTWVAVTITTANYSQTGSAASAKATIAFIYVFGAIYAVGFNPLLVLYPVEVLSFEIRAKGMAFSYLSGGAANLLNQFAWPVALERIGWKTYFCFIVWCAFQTAVVYFFIPETNNRTVCVDS